MSQPLRVLIAEDSEDDALLLLRELRRGGYDVVSERVDTPAAMHAALAERTWDVVVSDYSMPHFSAPAALALVQESGLALPFLIVSGTIGEERAVAALKAGANDYLMKGNLARLVPAVERELREAEGRRQREQLEEQLRQMQKMEAIGRLAGGVAHDFNNMLGAMIGYADYLRHRLATDEDACGCLEQILRAGERAAALTRQLLAFSRKQVLAPQVLDLNESMVGIHKMLRRLIGEDIELVTIPESAQAIVKADPGQIEQVLLNLAVNARDAMPQGGKLTIEIRNVELEEADAQRQVDLLAGPYVMLTVSDTGCGIGAETQAHIFEPFFTTKAPGEGTGLGLATVYGIVRQSGGQIQVESEPGHGARFTIYLPRTEEAMMPQTVPDVPSGTFSGSETILLVEDEPIFRKLVCQVLRTYGYAVLEATRGDEALRLCEQYASGIDLLLTDVVMPGMSGLELAQSVAALRPETKVIYMSGYADDAVLRHGGLKPGAAFLQKPFTPDVLARQIRNVLQG